MVSSFLRDYARAAKRETGVNDEEASRGDAGQGRSQGERRRERRRRKQREREQERAAIFGADPEPIQNPERAAWSAFAQSLFQSAEFRVIG